MKTKSLLNLIIAAVIALFSVAVQANEIVVGGKNYTEQLLMAEMTAQYLKSKGFETKKVDGLGSTVLRAAQKNAQVDIYWEYTGTSYTTYHKIKTPASAEETYNKVKELDGKLGIVWLEPSSANNTFALAVRKSDNMGLNTLSDLAAAYSADKKLSMGIGAEFSQRPDGLKGLQKKYGFRAGRANLVPMEIGLVYNALKLGEVDVGMVYATDGRIAAFDFQVLEDDKGFFPNYAMAPTVRKETLDQYPNLADLLNALSGKLDDAKMQELNSQIDVEKKTIEDVAANFLKSEGLI